MTSKVVEKFLPETSYTVFGQLNKSIGPKHVTERLSTEDTAFPYVSRAARKDPLYRDFMNRWDIGSGQFRLQTLRAFELSHLRDSYSGGNWLQVMHSGSFLPADLGTMSKDIRALAGITMPDAFSVGIGSMKDNLIPLGSKGISQGIPFEPSSQLGVALMEILPITKLSRLDFEAPKLPLAQIGELMLKAPSKTPLRDYLSAIGGEYLNMVFGWNPTVGDLRDTLSAVSNSRKILADYARRFEKHYRFHETVRDSHRGFSGLTSSNRAPVPALPSYFYKPGGGFNPLHVSGTVKERVWTAGSFLYHQYVEGNLFNQIDEWADQADHLLGLRPTVDKAWELVPFSWLADWQTNIGDVLKNVTYIGSDGLALHHAYAMHSYEYTAHVTNSGTRLDGSTNPREISCKVYESAKMRIKATPYGFAITPEEFSPKQWSILAALGLTKVNGRMND